MSRTEVFLMPSASSAFIKADDELLNVTKNSFLLGVDNRGFINYKFGNNKIKQEISYIPIVGETTMPRTCFNTNQTQNTNDYLLGQGIITKTGSNSIFIDHSKFSYTFLCGENNFMRGEIGLNENIQTDMKGYLKAGWFRCDPRKYLGYGFEGFSNPFIWNKRTAGVSLELNLSENFKFISSYGVKPKSSAESNNPIHNDCVSGNGLISTTTPFISSCGLSYESTQTGICDIKMSTIIQNINEGDQYYDSSNPLYWTVPNTQRRSYLSTDSNVALQNLEGGSFSDGSITTKASSALIQHVVNDSKYTQSYTGILSMKFMKNIEINGACSLSRFNTSDGDDQVTLSKWSIGTYSQSKSFLGSSSGNCINQFGINIGTPTYLQSGTDSLESDSTPTIFEFSCMLNLYGFNVPIYFDYFKNKTVGDSTYDSLDTSPTTSSTGNAFIIGIRPSKIFGYVIQDDMIKTEDKTILPCVGGNNFLGIEGSLLDEDE